MFCRKVLGFFGFISVFGCSMAMNDMCDAKLLHDKFSAVFPCLSEQNCKDIIIKVNERTFPDLYSFQISSQPLAFIGKINLTEIVRTPFCHALNDYNHILIPFGRSVHAARRKGDKVERCNFNCLLVTRCDGNVTNVEFEYRQPKKNRDNSLPKIYIDDESDFGYTRHF